MTVPRAGKVDVSVLVPARDEAENLPSFMEQCAEALGADRAMYEVIVVDDGSTDTTPGVLAQLRNIRPADTGQCLVDNTAPAEDRHPTIGADHVADHHWEQEKQHRQHAPA